jgi:hypothetical protein
MSQSNAFALLAAFLPLSAAPSLASAASSETLQRGLNALTAVTTVSEADRPAACHELTGALNDLAARVAAEPQWAALHRRVRAARKLFCLGRENNDDPLVQMNPLVWQEQPSCVNSPRYVYRCSYNHERGRGLLIYERPTPPAVQHYLVCAQSAGESRGLFSSGYSITSKCIVSSLNWHVYAKRDLSMPTRTDVKGVFNWERGRSMTRPIQLPRFLAEQCRSAFSEAIYCSPTLMVLPTLDPDVIDVCGLQTNREAFGVAFIQVSSASSRWSCQRKDLRVQTPYNDHLNTRDSECVPDWKGEVHPSCDLPYLPPQQNPIRERRDYER